MSKLALLNRVGRCALAIALLSPFAVRAEAPVERLAVHAGVVLDVVSGERLRDRWILVDGERIVAIQAQAPMA